jgi:uncharacterized protein (DUF4213/DUF364 family)
MNIYKRILASLPDFPVKDVRIGLNWTAVVVDKDGELDCGLATTLREGGPEGGPAILDPGRLEFLGSAELAGWILSEVPLRRSIGCATINALLPKDPSRWVNQNAEEAILELGQGKKSVMIGHFPFTALLREQLPDLSVLDLNPKGEDLPANEAPNLLPEAGLVAITGMAFINQTLQELLSYCKPEAFVLILGPSTPLSPVMGEAGVNLLAGAIVENIPAVLSALGQGANFRQLHKAGVRLITQPVT